MDSFRKHDEVFLYVSGSCNVAVGAGTLQKVLATDTLHNVALGECRVAVLVSDVFKEDCDIPYPLDGKLKLSETKDTLVLWNKEYVGSSQWYNPIQHSGDKCRYMVTSSSDKQALGKMSVPSF